MISRIMTTVTSAAMLALLATSVGAQVDHPIPGPLSDELVRLPDNIDDFIRDPDWAIALGKSFFWDMQAGSDGIQACASCHFNAGADGRTKGILNPNQSNMLGDPIASSFDPTATGRVGANIQLTLADFPFHQLEDPADRESNILFSTDDVAGSPGVLKAALNDVIPGFPIDDCACEDSAIFNVTGVNVRQVTGRNAPTTINSIFNTRQFWDGRANAHFNGVDPFGLRSKQARVLKIIPGQGPTPVQVDIFPASLASQAVGPPNSGVEMACAGRSFSQIAEKLLRLRPLGLQMVDANDSVLGPLARKGKPGLRLNYTRMIRKAFKPEWWRNKSYRTPQGYSMMQANFSLYWGLAVLMYESTLVSDQTRFDSFVSGDFTVLTTSELNGLDLFFNSGTIAGNCGNCHLGPTLTSATLNHQLFGTVIPGDPETVFPHVESMVIGTGDRATYDGGFYNLGVRPTSEDIGTGGLDPFGNHLSFTRQIFDNITDGTPISDPEALGVGPTLLLDDEMRDAVDGSFKVPTLRNIELTGPYFHNGGYGTLRSVIEFYNRGGNRRAMDLSQAGLDDTTGWRENSSNIAESMNNMGLTDDEIDDMVAFLKTLTDERVRWEMAPFDHPQLFLAAGAMGDEILTPPAGVICNATLMGVDVFSELPAVGADGRAAKGLNPIRVFEESLK
jgi:cytochrome c peroxidase